VLIIIIIVNIITY